MPPTRRPHPAMANPKTFLPRLVPALLLGGAMASAGLLPASGDLQAQEIRIPQGAQDQVVDRIAAVVGDSVIFMTQVEEGIIRRTVTTGQPMPTDPEVLQALRREVVEELVNEQLLLQAAARDTTVVVPEERIESTLRMAWDDELSRWGTEAALRAELERSQGMTVAQYRAQLREQIRRGLTVQTYVQSRSREARPVAVDEAEILAFYEANREQIGRRPATIRFQQVFVDPMPGDSAMAEARSEIERIMQLIREGGDFESLARQYSQDPGSQQRGGDLGWSRRGDGLVREFEEAAFQLREGGMVGPVETQYGAHLIRVDRVRGAERRISHILISAPVTAEDLAATRSRADEVRDRIRDGEPLRSFTERQRAQGIPDEVEATRTQLEQAPAAFGPLILGGSQGDILGPVEFPVSETQSTWGIFRILEVRPEGEYTLEDLRGQIRERLQAEKRDQRMIQDLRARTYVDIRI